MLCADVYQRKRTCFSSVLHPLSFDVVVYLLRTTSLLYALQPARYMLKVLLLNLSSNDFEVC